MAEEVKPVVSAGSPAQAAHDEPMFHNPVLTRSHEPPRAEGGRWMMVTALVVVIVAGAAFWVYVKSQPAPQVVNHAVASSTSAGTG